jgi:hypothetical protein
VASLHALRDEYSRTLEAVCAVAAEIFTRRALRTFGAQKQLPINNINLN